MTIYFATGSPTTALTHQQLRESLRAALDRIGPRDQVMALPPDFTRVHSQAGPITCHIHEYYGHRLADIMPALGTHTPMPDWQLAKMFPTVPTRLFREHRWREDVVPIGQVPGDYVSQVTEGIYDQPWPAQLNKLVWQGGHDLILSIGQVVPHEVVGMANFNKNIFVGTGGAAGINQSHFLGAVYGMERMMGRGDTPLRQVFNYAQRQFCSHLPLVFVLTVIGPDDDGQSVIRGLYVGDDAECFELACALSVEVNVTLLDEQLKRVVVYLDPDEFHSTWLGNKAVYRTRMAIADGGQLIVLAPGVCSFGEDTEIDRLIRKYGYRTTPQIMQAVQDNADLQANLSAAAHLIHGSSEGRFQITYCPGELSRDEIQSVGYHYGDLAEMQARYDVSKLRTGWNTDTQGKRFFFVQNPALGLWAHRERFV